VADLGAFLKDLDPDLVSTGDATKLFGLFAEVSRLGAAGQVVLAPRVAKSDRWKSEGHRSAASWVAQASGTGLGDAIATLETADRLGGLPGTAQAMRDGRLSAPQVREIAAAAAVRPQSEGELIEAAATCTMKGLKDRCRRVRAMAGSAQDEKARYEEIRAGRFFRHWSNADGAFRGVFKLTPDDGAKLLSSLEPRADMLFDEARKAGRREPATAYVADALVELVTGTNRAGRGSGPPVMHIRVDAAALRRGYVDGDEVCEIPGVGLVPVATARALLPESFVKILVTEGVDILSMCHVGRSIPAHVRSALEERDPTCVVPGCEFAVGLEIDHWETPYACGGATALANLARLCHFHHAMKTYGGFELRGGPGKWEWESPPPFETTGQARSPKRGAARARGPSP
jgi:hypothetical protein